MPPSTPPEAILDRNDSQPPIEVFEDLYPMIDGEITDARISADDLLYETDLSDTLRKLESMAEENRKLLTEGLKPAQAKEVKEFLSEHGRECRVRAIRKAIDELSIKRGYVSPKKRFFPARIVKPN